nr:flagellar hook-length control protein [Mycobacteroides abscessus]
MTTTKRDAIEAAMSIADVVASGKLDPASLEQQMLTELRDLVGTVVGQDDPLWDLQLQVASGVLAAGGVPTDELAEWLAVQRRRENPEAAEALSGLVPLNGSTTSTEPVSDGSVAHGPSDSASDDDDYLAGVPEDVLREAESAALAVIAEWRAQQ